MPDDTVDAGCAPVPDPLASILARVDNLRAVHDDVDEAVAATGDLELTELARFARQAVDLLGRVAEWRAAGR